MNYFTGSHINRMLSRSGGAQHLKLLTVAVTAPASHGIPFYLYK